MTGLSEEDLLLRDQDMDLIASFSKISIATSSSPGGASTSSATHVPSCSSPSASSSHGSPFRSKRPSYKAELFTSPLKSTRTPEPLLDPSSERFCMFPIKYQCIWEFYKKAEVRDCAWMIQDACRISLAWKGSYILHFCPQCTG